MVPPPVFFSFSQHAAVGLTNLAGRTVDVDHEFSSQMDLGYRVNASETAIVRASFFG
jgi:hypothetical protein